MTGGYKNGNTQKILDALRDFGPMTRSELEQHMGLPRTALSGLTRGLLKPRATMPKRIHITQWVYDQEGQKRYPRAVLALGNYPDAKPPVRDTKANQRRHRSKRRTLFATNSVFNLKKLVRGYADERDQTNQSSAAHAV
jgi:hypothetical protein